MSPGGPPSCTEVCLGQCIEDGIALEPTGPKTQSFSLVKVQLLLFPIQIFTASRHQDKMSMVLLNSPEAKTYHQCIDDTHPMAMDELSQRPHIDVE